MKGSDSALLLVPPENTDRLVSPSSLIKGIETPLGTNSRGSRSRTKRDIRGDSKETEREDSHGARVDRNGADRDPGDEKSDRRDN